MTINEKKMQIVIDNYFKSECNVDTSIRDAFEKGFRIGVQKKVCRPKGEWIEYKPAKVYLNGEAVYAYMNNYACSVCGGETHIKYDYCPYCGARMI